MRVRSGLLGRPANSSPEREALTLEARIFKVVVMYRNLNAKEAGAIYVLASGAEEAEKRATEAMDVFVGRNRKVIAVEYLVDRTVNWIAITGHDGVIAEG
jgi:hypothetical protein